MYDKTRQASADAPIRDLWAASLGRQLPPSAQVWRVEFEVRSTYLRSLARHRARVTTDPRELLATELDAIWAHLMTGWLVLRDRRSRGRLDRRPAQPWWSALAGATGLSEVATCDGVLERRPRVSGDTEPLLRQMAGLLAAFGARSADRTLDGCLAALAEYMRRGDSKARFEAAVERAALKLPLAAIPADRQADACSVVGDTPVI